MYPEVKGLWFDGTWDKSWKKNGQFSYELEKHLKEIRPGLIINSRMRADEFGNWMGENGEAIYGCGYGGLEKQDWGYFTKNQKSRTLYMVVFNVPIDKKLRVKLPKGLNAQKSYMLQNKHNELTIKKFNDDESFIILQNRKYNDPFVIVLETGVK